MEQHLKTSRGGVETKSITLSSKLKPSKKAAVKKTEKAVKKKEPLAEAYSKIEKLLKKKNPTSKHLEPILELLARVPSSTDLALAVKRITEHTTFRGIANDLKRDIKTKREEFERALEHKEMEGQHAAAKAAETAPSEEKAGVDNEKKKVDYGPLNYFNDAGYAVAQVADKIVILQPPRVLGVRPDSETIHEPVRFMTASDFKLKYANHLFTDVGGDLWPAVDKWLESKYRRTYRAVICEPYGLGGKDPTASDVFNLFPGYAVTGKPKPGSSCALFLAHLRNNVCQGNQEHYEWLVSWFSQMLCDPSHKPGTAVVLRGLRGTGKTKVGEVIARLYLPWSVASVSKPKDITGDFPILNGTIIFCVAEEAFFAADRSQEGPLKDVITGKTMIVSYKHVNKFQSPNHVHLMMTTNSHWSVPAGDVNDERRFFVLDVGADHKDDHVYFAALENELDNGGMEALARFLLDWKKPEHVNLRKPPITDALREQAEYSEPPITRWLRSILSAGRVKVGHDDSFELWSAGEIKKQTGGESKAGLFAFSGTGEGVGNGVVAGDGVMLIPKDVLRNACVLFAKENGLRAADVNSVAVGKALGRVGVVSERVRKDGVPDARYYALPPLETMRAGFEAEIGDL